MADETRANYPDLIKLEMTDGTLRKKKTRMNTSLNREREDNQKNESRNVQNSTDRTTNVGKFSREKG